METIGVEPKFVFEEVGPGVDPLSPEERLICGRSPLSVTKSPSIAKLALTARTPLTDMREILIQGFTSDLPSLWQE
jgi:aldehyde:ferredoxin oxidoreductase